MSAFSRIADSSRTSWEVRKVRQIQTCAPLHSIEDSASKQRVEPSDRLAATVEVCRLKKGFRSRSSISRKPEQSHLKLNVMACSSQAGPGVYKPKTQVLPQQ